MKKPVIKFLKISSSAQIPTYAHYGDAGFDLYSTEKLTIKRGYVSLVKTGIASEIPDGYFISFRGKSGLAAKFGIDVLGGVIDSTYRGEWVVILINLGQKKYKIEKGDKIAQGILQPCPRAKIIETKKLKNSVRGQGRFGSTGK